MKEGKVINVQKPAIDHKYPDYLTPEFANTTEVIHTSDEVCIIFTHQVPFHPVQTVKAIMSMTPVHAKKFWNVLGTTLENYEKKFGKLNKQNQKTESTGVEVG